MILVQSGVKATINNKQINTQITDEKSMLEGMQREYLRLIPDESDLNRYKQKTTGGMVFKVEEIICDIFREGKVGKQAWLNHN